MGISQEDIDKMLQDAGTGAADKPGARLYNAFIASVKNIFSTLTGSMVDASFAGEEVVTPEEIGPRLTPDVLLFISSLKVKETIPVGHLLPRPLAASVVGKIVGEPQLSKLEESHIGALREAMGNLIGAWSTSLTEILGTEVKPVAPPEFIASDPGKALADKGVYSSGNVVLWDFKLTIDDMSWDYYLMLPTQKLEGLLSRPEETKSTQRPTESQPPVIVADEQTTKSAPSPPERKTVEVEKAAFQELDGPVASGEASQIELLLDVPLTVSVELGRKRLSIREVLDLVPGSLLELEKLAGEPVDLMVNGKLFAHGEVVVIDENFGVRISTIVSPKERLERLR